MRNKLLGPWNYDYSDEGFVVRSLTGDPVCFVYGESNKSKTIAEAIINLEFSFQEEGESE